jgi:hypothetical protein
MQKNYDDEVDQQYQGHDGKYLQGAEVGAGRSPRVDVGVAGCSRDE